MPYSKSPQLTPRPAWSVWGSRVCLFSGTLLFFGSLLPPILTQVNATIRAKTGNSAQRETSVTKATAETIPSAEIAQPVPATPTQSRTPQPYHVLPGNSSKSPTGGSAADRQEILLAYSDWKKAWLTTDLDKCMSLYTIDIRFTDIGGSVYNHDGLKGWFKNTWGASGYRVLDWEPPRLRIRGNRALLVTKQGYTRGGSASINYVSRYLWEKRAIPDTDKYRWLIVEEAYLPYNGERNMASQIY